MFTFCNCSR